jgi:tRNA(fMet)-specific endonuclease VapC
MDNAGKECVATVISYEEQCRGWLSAIAKARTVSDEIIGYRKLLVQLHNYCAIRVIEFDERAAIEFQALKKGKIRIGTMDLKIAAMVIATDSILLTRNARFHQGSGTAIRRLDQRIEASP